MWLEDDGTLDTVIAVQPVAPRIRREFDSEYWPVQRARYSDTSDSRNADGALTASGFMNLARDAASGYEFE